MSYAPDPRDDNQGIIRLAAASWEGFQAINISRHPGRHAMAHGSVALAMPLVHLPGARIEIEGLRDRHTDSRRGTHCLLPAGAQLRGAWSCPTDYLILKLDDALLVALEDEGVSPARLRPRAGVDDPVVFQLGLLLKEELESGGARGRLYRESLAHAIAAAALAPDAAPRRGSEPPQRLRNAIAFMRANLHADVSVGDVAAAAHLSPRQLQRAFRDAFGLAPHRYLLGQRIARAKLLLADRDLALDEVALRCGFKTASHFARVFRDVAGVTPGAYRAAL
jgi:AraC family transcriptional regulator